MILAMNGKIEGQSLLTAANTFYQDVQTAGGNQASTVESVFQNKYGLDMVLQNYDSNEKTTFWLDIRSSILLNHPLLLLTRQFTDAGHYIVIVGYREKDGKREVIAYDPYGRWTGEQNSYQLNSAEEGSAVGRWVWYDLEDIWAPGWLWRWRKPYLFILGSALNHNNEVLNHATTSPDTPPDLISLEDGNVGFYGGVPIDYQIFLPVTVKTP